MAPSAARERLLRTASELFYAEGIRAVGVDRVIGASEVTRATFYRHFPSKDDLVVAYLGGIDRAIRALAEATPGGEPRLRALVGAMGEQLCSVGFRGCPFLNALAEFPDRESPVHQAAAAHRAWLLELFATDLATTGHPEPTRGAAHLMMLRDGAMVAGHLAEPGFVRETLERGVGAVLAA